MYESESLAKRGKNKQKKKNGTEMNSDDLKMKSVSDIFLSRAI